MPPSARKASFARVCSLSLPPPASGPTFRTVCFLFPPLPPLSPIPPPQIKGTGEAECKTCQYVYSPKVGDSNYPVSPGTLFQVRGMANV